MVDNDSKAKEGTERRREQEVILLRGKEKTVIFINGRKGLRVTN